MGGMDMRTWYAICCCYISINGGTGGEHFDVAKVSKALGSVSQMVDGGNRVTFDVDAQGRDI